MHTNDKLALALKGASLRGRPAVRHRLLGTAPNAADPRRMGIIR
jgi:hypothetical protein